MHPRRTHAHRRASAAILAATLSIATLLLVTPVGTAAGAADSVLVNGSFESPQTGGYVYAPSGAGWTFTGYGGIQHNGSAFSGSTTAPDGTQTAFLQGAKGTLGTMSQTVTLTAGTYSLSYQAARRWNTIQPILISIDGTTIGTYTPTDTTFTPTTTATFTATAGTHTIQFAATDSSTDRTTFIDTVTINTSTTTPPSTTPTGATHTTSPTPTTPATTPTASPTPTTPPTNPTPTTPAATPTPTTTPSTGTGSATALGNGSFESPQTGGYVYTPSGAGWTFTGYGGIQHNGSAFSGSTTAPDGTQTAFLQGAKGTLGTMSQTVTLTAGTYSLSYQAARRWNTIQPILISIDGTTIGTYTPTDSTFTPTTTATFTATAGTHTIQFAATDSSADRTTFIDTVTINTSTTTPPATPTPTPTPTGATPTVTPTTPGTTGDIDLTDYRPTFADEFDALSVRASSPKGASTWYAYPPYGPAGNFSSSAWTPDALSTSGGVLSNRAYQSGGKWYSGYLSSADPTGAGFSQLYGYFEARVKMPNSGVGSWPAFWLTSTNGIPAVSPTAVRNEEIDVFEWYGTTNQPGNPQPYVQQASHNYTGTGSQNPSGSSYLYQPLTRMPGGAYPWQGYHTYGVLIDPAHVTWYIDGVQTNQIATPTEYLTSPFYMMVDYGLGGGYPLTGVVNGSALQVDWVRAYALPGR